MRKNIALVAMVIVTIASLTFGYTQKLKAVENLKMALENARIAEEQARMGHEQLAIAEAQGEQARMEADGLRAALHVAIAEAQQQRLIAEKAAKTK